MVASTKTWFRSLNAIQSVQARYRSERLYDSGRITVRGGPNDHRPRALRDVSAHVKRKVRAQRFVDLAMGILR